jgi:predicted amidohydrolase YtcJ
LTLIPVGYCRVKRFLPVLVLLLAACGQQSNESATSAAQVADRVFLNARIYTLEESAPWAEALAIRGDEIVYVGDNAGAQAYTGEATTVTDLGGKMMLPGFIETHMHLGTSIAYANAVTLSPAMSKREVLATVAEHVAAYPDQDPIVGMGFLGTAFGELGPTAADLDAIVSDRAVFIQDEGVHTAWINTEAMRRAGVTKETPDPVPGSHYFKRYPDGTPTGWLMEGGAYGPVAEALGTVSADSLRQGAEDFYPVLSQMGLTAVFDAGITEMIDETLEVLARTAENGQLPVRVVASHYVNTAEALPTAVARVRELQQRYHDELLDFRVLKLSLDGTVEARTALLLEPWRGEDVNTTQPLIPADASAAVVLQAAADNMDVHLHALGDGAVRLALDMVEAARTEFPASTSRFTMCHLQVVNPADVPRFAQLDVVAQSTPSWYAFDDVALEALGQERFEQMYPLRSIAEAGARLTFGSDYPATWIGLDGLNPLFNMEMAITRQAPGDPDFPVQPLASERVSLEQAIRAYTLDAAWQLRLEEQVGSLRVGKQADLVVLSTNLFDLDSYAVHAAEVLLTMMNGRVVYDQLSAAAP